MSQTERARCWFQALFHKLKSCTYHRGIKRTVHVSHMPCFDLQIDWLTCSVVIWDISCWKLWNVKVVFSCLWEEEQLMQMRFHEAKALRKYIISGEPGRSPVLDRGSTLFLLVLSSRFLGHICSSCLNETRLFARAYNWTIGSQLVPLHRGAVENQGFKHRRL